MNIPLIHEHTTETWNMTVDPTHEQIHIIRQTKPKLNLVQMSTKLKRIWDMELNIRGLFNNPAATFVHFRPFRLSWISWNSIDSVARLWNLVVHCSRRPRGVRQSDTRLAFILGIFQENNRDMSSNSGATESTIKSESSRAEGRRAGRTWRTCIEKLTRSHDIFNSQRVWNLLLGTRLNRRAGWFASAGAPTA